MKKVLSFIARWLELIIFALMFGLPIIMIWLFGFVVGIAYGIFIKGFNGQVWYPGK